MVAVVEKLMLSFKETVRLQKCIFCTNKVFRKFDQKEGFPTMLNI